MKKKAFLTKKCDHCKRSYKCRASAAPRRRFCSILCSNRWKWDSTFNQCGIGGCERRAQGDGMCSAHRLRKTRGRGLRENTPIGAPTSELDRATRFWKFVRKTRSCWYWTGATRDGYGLFSLAVGSRNAHRFSWHIHNGPIPKGVQVLHRCDNRLCVNPAHLFLGTLYDNMADRNAKSRQARGETSGRAKLTEKQVKELRKMREGIDYIGWGRAKEIASQYAVSPMTLQGIWAARSWKHLL